jgi:exopolysaccharide biosynthesis protein
MNNNANKPKPSVQQSLAEFTASLRSFGAKVMPHIGFIHLVIVLAGITTVVFMVSQTIQSTDVGAGTATSERLNEYSIPFDQATITKIKDLSSHTSTPSAALPHGRINPFSESVY